MNPLLNRIKFQSAFSKKVDNPYYFFSLGLVIFCIHAWHIQIKFSSQPFIFIKLLSLGFLEAIIEASFFCVLSTLVKGKKILHTSFLIMAAFLPIIHLIDFFLERLFNLSFVTTLISFCAESLPNMLELIYATNISVWFFILGLGLLTFLGVLFLKIKSWFDRFYDKKPISVELQKLGLFVLFAIMITAGLKISFHEVHTLNQAHFKVLPLKLFLGKQKSNLLGVDLTQIKNVKHKPYVFTQEGNVFLFVIESLRDDAINKQVAPTLSSLGENFYRHPFCMASANATQLSWYSIFFGKSSFFWKEEEKNLGSPLLKMFKDNGYKTYVISSPRLSYYNMDKRFFGKNYEWIESYICPRNGSDGDAYEADKACFEYLKKQVALKKDEKKLFVIFLDATHFGYSLPKKQKHPFNPSVDHIPYLGTLFLSRHIEEIKNRYFNSIHGLDDLFNDLFSHLKNENAFDEATIICTADHGEEFFEKGQLFHASHLSQEQLHVPFIVKTSSRSKVKLSKEGVFSHENILSFLGSILSDQGFENPNYQMSSRFLFSLSPEEGVIVTKNKKYFGSYDQKSHKLNIKSVFDLNDEKLQTSDFNIVKEGFDL